MEFLARFRVLRREPLVRPEPLSRPSRAREALIRRADRLKRAALRDLLAKFHGDRRIKGQAFFVFCDLL